MTDYIYTREMADGRWDMENQHNVDGEGEQIYIAKEIEAALPGKNFKVFGCGSELKVSVVDPALTAEEETTLDDCISLHKSHTA